MNIYKNLLLAAALLLGTMACSKPPGNVDAFFGMAHELSIVTQIADTEAGVHQAPAKGMSGPVATKVIKRYQKGFDLAPQEPVRFTIGTKE